MSTLSVDRFELISLADVAPGEEVHLAYTKGNLTSAEHFAQYGFAPPGGSPTDRLDLRGDGDSGDERDGDGDSGDERDGDGDSGDGDKRRGGDKVANRLKAALKARLKEALMAASDGGGGKNGPSDWVAAAASIAARLGSAGDPMTSEEETAALEALKRRVKALESSWRTSLEEDEASAAALRNIGAGGGVSGADGDGERERNERMGNILGLRLNKKRLARRVAEMLDNIGDGLC